MPWIKIGVICGLKKWLVHGHPLRDPLEIVPCLLGCALSEHHVNLLWSHIGGGVPPDDFAVNGSGSPVVTTDGEVKILHRVSLCCKMFVDQ